MIRENFYQVLYSFTYAMERIYSILKSEGDLVYIMKWMCRYGQKHSFIWSF